MALTPIDVQQKTFRQAFKGYDGGEVDQFLDEVVIALRDSEQKVRESEDRVAVLEDQLRSRVDSDDSIKRAFLSAQRAADDLIDNAKIESDGILARAREEATSLTEEQASEKAVLLSELDSLRETTTDLVARLRAAASKEIGALETLADDATEASAQYASAQHSAGGAAPDPESSAVGNGDADGDAAGETGEEAVDGAGEGEVDEVDEVDEMPTETMSAWNRSAPVEVEQPQWDEDNTATQEVPTLRRPWERGADQT